MLKLGANRLVRSLRSLKQRPWLAALFAAGLMALLSSEVWARAGGGGSYGGGGGSGGGGGGIGALLYIIFQLLRFLIWLTIEYPAIGIPIDIVVVILIVWWLVRKATAKSTNISVNNTVAPAQQLNLERAWSQLRRFDPNF